MRKLRPHVVIDISKMADGWSVFILNQGDKYKTFRVKSENEILDAIIKWFMEEEDD